MSVFRRALVGAPKRRAESAASVPSSRFVLEERALVRAKELVGMAVKCNGIPGDEATFYEGNVSAVLAPLNDDPHTHKDWRITATSRDWEVKFHPDESDSAGSGSPACDFGIYSVEDMVKFTEEAPRMLKWVEGLLEERDVMTPETVGRVQSWVDALKEEIGVEGLTTLNAGLGELALGAAGGYKLNILRRAAASAEDTGDKPAEEAEAAHAVQDRPVYDLTGSDDEHGDRLAAAEAGGIGSGEKGDPIVLD